MKINKKFIIFTIIHLCFLYSAFGQMAIKGTVVNADNGETLPGVNVIEKGTTNGTITDMDGNYRIIVSDQAKELSFTFVGYDNYIEQINGRSEINVELSAGITIDELVVVGYGTQKKESVVGAITQVDGDKLVSSGTNNISTAIAGKLSGVVTLQTDGKPGEEEPNIYIRGTATWNGSSPLILVDGIQRTSWADIDPNEIASISVLKDASATAVYGAKGGNGVILIKTKQGKKGAPKYTFSYAYGMKSVSEDLDYLDAYTTLTRFNTALKNDNLWNLLYSEEALEHYRLQDEPYVYPSVNWIEEMYTTGYSNNANLSVTGGSEAINYFVSLGYFRDGDILNLEKKGDFDPRNYYNRYNLRTNLDFKLTKTTTISTKLSGSNQKRNRPSVMNRGGHSPVWSAIYTSAVNSSPVYYPASILEEYPDPNDPGADELRYAFYNNGHIFNNPYSMIYTTGFENENEMNINTDVILDQDLDFLTKGLKFKASISYGTNTEYNRQYGGGAFSQLIPTYHLTVNEDDSYMWSRQPLYHEDVPAMNFGGESLTKFFRTLYYDAHLNYNRTFNMHHNVTALAVFRRKQINRGSQEPFKEEAWSGRLTYSFMGKYLFETNLGYTGSEQFAPGMRFGFFPAYALGWNVHRERFFANNFESINKFKMRYSYGKVGIDNGARWLYYQNYSTGSGNWLNSGAFGADGTYDRYGDNYYQEGKIANNVVTWETAIKQNLGFELQFFKKLDLSIDFFKETRDDILEEPHTIPLYTGLKFKELNIGKTKSHGYEIELGLQHQFSKDFSINVITMMSYAENRVLFRDDPPNMPEYQKQAGYPIGQPRELISAGRFESVDDINNYTQPGTSQSSYTSAGYPNIYFYGIGDEKFVDYNGDGIINGNDIVAYGYPLYPKYHASFSLLLQYKGFELNTLFAGQFLKTSGLGDVTVPFGSEFPYLYEHQLDYYTADNQDAFYPAIHAGTYGKLNTRNPAYSRPVSSFIRLKEIQLSYTANLKNNKLIDRFTVFANANNLWTYAPNIYFGDPEKPRVQPAQDNSYPLVKRFNFGITMHY